MENTIECLGCEEPIRAPQSFVARGAEGERIFCLDCEVSGEADYYDSQDHGDIYCGSCKSPCEPQVTDHGIGHYEYWGFQGYDSQLDVSSRCCDADTWSSPDCSSVRYRLQDHKDREADAYADYYADY